MIACLRTVFSIGNSIGQRSLPERSARYSEHSGHGKRGTKRKISSVLVEPMQVSPIVLQSLVDPAVNGTFPVNQLLRLEPVGDLTIRRLDTIATVHDVATRLNAAGERSSQK